MTEFTTAEYERSHGRKPSGTGVWAFQTTVNRTAFDSERVGEVWFTPAMTYEQAKQYVRDNYAARNTTVAVLP